MTLVKKGQRHALKELGNGTAHDDDDTVFGEKRSKIVSDVEVKAQTIVPTQALQNFTKRTGDITKMKQDWNSLIKDPKQKCNIASAKRKLRAAFWQGWQRHWQRHWQRQWSWQGHWQRQ